MTTVSLGHLLLRTASVVSAVFCLALSQLAAAAPAATTSTAEFMFIYDPALSNEPATDAPAQIIEAHAINLPAEVSSRKSNDIQGRISVRVRKDGSIDRVRFDTTRPAKAVVAQLERGLASWRFAPMTRSGKPVETWVQLVYSSAPAPVPGADSPARSLFAVLPSFPIELWRPWALTGAAAPVVSMPGDSKPMAQKSGGKPTPIGDNPRVGTAQRHNTLGTPGTGPSMLDHAGWFSGHTTLRVDIDEHGLVTGAFVVQSTASCFEPLAVAPILKWRFIPSIAAGAPIASRMIVPITAPGTIENPPPLFFKPDPASKEGWDEPPRLRFLDLPVYPQDLLAAGVTGRASARVALDATGAITRVDLIDATKPEFGHALLASIRRCQHEPARRGGRRVAVSLVRTAAFASELWDQKPVVGEVPALTLFPTDYDEPVPEAALDRPLKQIVATPPAFALTPSAGEPVSAKLQFIVSRDGLVQAPHIITASSPEAGYAAVQAVAPWCYAPPVSGGATVPAVAELTFTSK